MSESLENIEYLKDKPETVEKVLQLEPASFNYNNDPDKITQYGLIAEEVNEVFPELITYDKDGQIRSVKYHKLFGLLLAKIKDLQNKLINSKHHKSDDI